MSASVALMTMALADRGIDAVSYTGSQVGIITDTAHRKAKILEVKGDRVRQSLSEGKVCVIAGFQGVSTAKEITTMGRGASDLTASALAQAMGADACEIYTDVTGVFSADPRIVPQARKLPPIIAMVVHHSPTGWQRGTALIDLFDLDPLVPFTQRGLGNALLLMGFVAIGGLMVLTETG